MQTINKELEIIANCLLTQNATLEANEIKPNYSNRDFMNTLIIFQTALMDKIYDIQENENMSVENRLKMAKNCGLELRKLIHTFTGLDTHKLEDFI